MTKHAKDIELEPIDRFAFYEEARSCFAVVQVMEVRCCTSPPPRCTLAMLTLHCSVLADVQRRPYGNVILQKGVVGPDGLDLKP